MSTVTGGSIFDIFKTQILLNQKDNMIYGLIILTIFEVITGFLREFFSWAKGYANEYVKKKLTNKIQEAVRSTVQDNTAELFFERNYARNDNWDRADADFDSIGAEPEETFPISSQSRIPYVSAVCEEGRTGSQASLTLPKTYSGFRLG